RRIPAPSYYPPLPARRWRSTTTAERAMHETMSTGVRGLNAILPGGLPRGHLYLLEGDPGAGKTTLALQFLLEGRDRGEQVLYCTLSETRSEIEQIARSHGWDLDGVTIFELS